MKKNKMLLWTLIVSISLLVIILCYINSSNNTAGVDTDGQTDNIAEVQTESDTNPNSLIEEYQDVKVRVEMENGGTFIIELYAEYAPETVANFVKLVGEGFYDGLTFHRVVDGFMAQGGDPNGDGTGGCGIEIKGEFSSNGVKQNILKHTKGVISMARGLDPNSASSQFFIMFDTITSLDGKYAAFGKVIEGMEVIEDFQKVERTVNSFGERAIPVEPLVMKYVTIVEG